MKYLTWIILLVLSTQLQGQSTAARSQCTNPAFEKKIESYLDNSVPTISVSDAYRHQDQYQFLDAREVEEYNISHIPEASYIGYDDFSISNIEKLDKDTPIVVYCSIGYRSEKIGEKLQKAGFSNVYNLYGSIFEWANQGLVLENKSGEPTKEIHTYNKKWSKWVINEDITKVW